jgi:hypothetical protein
LCCFCVLPLGIESSHYITYEIMQRLANSLPRPL